MTRLRDTPVIVVALRGHHSHTHTHPHNRILLPAAPDSACVFRCLAWRCLVGHEASSTCHDARSTCQLVALDGVHLVAPVALDGVRPVALVDRGLHLVALVDVALSMPRQGARRCSGSTTKACSCRPGRRHWPIPLATFAQSVKQRVGPLMKHRCADSPLSKVSSR